MRKIRMLAALIALVMMLSSVSFAWAEDDEVKMFEPTLVNMLEIGSAEEAMKTKDTRATISVALAVDLLLEDIADVEITSTSYIGRSENDLYFYFHLQEQDLIVVYSPTINAAAYIFVESVMPDSAVEGAMENSCPDGFYQNDSDAVMDVLMMLLDALSDE